MGFATMAAINTAIAAGQRQRLYATKTTPNLGSNLTAELFTSGTFPSAGSWAGTAGVAVAPTRSTTGALPLGPNVSTLTRHLSKISCFVSGTPAPQVLQLVDILLYYPSLVTTGTPTTLDNSITLPRYTDGVGVMGSVFVHTVLSGASALTLTYDTDAASGLTDSLNAAATGAGSAYAPTGVLRSVLITGSDAGIKKITSYTITTAPLSGTVAFVLYKPLIEIPLCGTYANTLDCINEICSMERIYDDACLAFISQAGASAASATLRASLECIWG